MKWSQTRKRVKMKDWKPVTTSVERGDLVATPHGNGKVMRVSQAQKTAHVMMGDGGTLEVPLEQVTKQGSPQGTPETPQGELKVGDKVKIKDTGAKGKVSKVDGNHIEFKHSANGKRRWLGKNQVEKLDGSTPKDTPKGDTPKQDAPEATPKKPIEWKTPSWEDGEFKQGDRVELKDGTSKAGTKATVVANNGDEEYTVKLDGGMSSGGHSGNDEPEIDNDGWFVSGKNMEKIEEPAKEEPKEIKEDKASETQKEQDVVKQTGDGLSELFKIKEYLENKIDTSVDGELEALREAVKKNQKLEIKIGDTVTKVEGKRHKQLETLITYSALRIPTLLVGMAGTGKTHAGEQASEALDVPFYAMSVGAQTSKTDIIGYMDANGNYVKTFFRDAYQNGGVFLMDEIDAGNANVLIQVNAALSNGLCAFPDEMVKKHKDFVFIASANTYGTGASRQYVGRNQLDAATLDRFAIIDWEIDDELEQSLAVGIYGQAWYQAVKASRAYVAEHNIRAIVSPRATQKGSQLLSAGIHVDEVVKAVLLGSVPMDKKEDVTKVATKIFDDTSRDVPSKVAEAIGEVNPF